MTQNITTPFDPRKVTRPDPALWRYYLIVSALTFIGFPFVLLPLYFKYKTLNYHFDDKGVSMSWGMLFKREIYLTYRRIQDIHVTRGLIQRWLGLASVSVQTASGASGAEMTIEGILHPEALRDYLYKQMRGAQDDTDAGAETATAGDRSNEASDQSLELLNGILQEVKQLRAQLEQRP